MKIDFENYLQEQFMKDEPQVLDDDIPDAFDAWLETKDVNDIIEYSGKYDKIVKDKILEFIGKDEEFVNDNLRWGDTDYHSNSIRFGRNELRYELKNKLK